MAINYIMYMARIENNVKQQLTTIAKHSSRSSSMLLLHEHNFVSATLAKGTNRILFRCITCDISYCSVCGKVLEGRVTNHQCY
jgi:hypothetical protein